MNDSLRKLMAAIAVGLPIGIPVVTAPFNVGGCYPLGYECPIEIRAVTVEHPNDGSLTEVECRAACDGTPCRVVDATHVECLYEVRNCPPAGRPPAGALAVEASPLSRDPRLLYLRDAAVMEAASVGAFEELARRLEAHGAPDALVAASRVARDDEARHAEAMVRLVASRSGGARVRVLLKHGPTGSLEELAIANIVDGCIGEAWAAYEAAHQALAAEDADVRSAMHTIAREEAAHALLSFAIDDWARARLGTSARRRVDAAGARARSQKRAELAGRVVPAGLGLVVGPEATRAFDLVG